MSQLDRSVNLLEDKNALKRVLNALVQWAKANGMSFNKTKWKVLPLSHNNPIQKKKRKSNWLGEEQLETS